MILQEEVELGEVENVRVVVRVRPLNEKECNSAFKSIVNVDTVTNTVIVNNPNAQAGEPPKTFTFDLVFGPDSKQVSKILLFWHQKLTLYK